MKLIFALLIIAVPALQAQAILFEDDFSDGNADGWTEWDPDGTYEVNADLRYQLSYPGTGDVDPIAVRGDVDDIYMSTNNYSVRVKVIAHSPTEYVGVALRFTDEFRGYVAYLRYLNDDVCICRHDSMQTPAFLGFADTCVLDYDEEYWLRFKCENDLFLVKVWEGQSYEEPDEWLLIGSDPIYADGGCMGLAAVNSGEGACDVEFDNVQVVGYPPSSALEQSTWAGIKAAF